MFVHLDTTFQVSSIILTSFRRDNFTSPIAKRTPKKPTQVRIEKETLAQVFPANFEKL